MRPAADLAAQLEEARREAAAAHAQAAAARSRGALVEKAWQSAVEVRPGSLAVRLWQWGVQAAYA